MSVFTDGHVHLDSSATMIAAPMGSVMSESIGTPSEAAPPPNAPFEAAMTKIVTPPISQKAGLAACWLRAAESCSKKGKGRSRSGRAGGNRRRIQD